MRLILASASPRRQELIVQLGIPVEILPSHADEASVQADTPRQFAERAAELKCREIASRPECRDAVVIGADTIVCFGPDDFFPESALLGKPAHPEHAVEMLHLLSGRTHTVITALAVSRPNGAEPRIETLSEDSLVTFQDLTDERIRVYVEGGEPLDKAGAYGAQGAAGEFIERIEGNLDNVIGLPTELLRRMLKDAGGLA